VEGGPDDGLGRNVRTVGPSLLIGQSSGHRPRLQPAQAAMQDDKTF